MSAAFLPADMPSGGGGAGGGGAAAGARWDVPPPGRDRLADGALPAALLATTTLEGREPRAGAEEEAFEGRALLALPALRAPEMLGLLPLPPPSRPAAPPEGRASICSA
ncbi:MAG TPA: hypothetical protein VD972_30015, partial [Hyalangium sp.]|nr:hypothetical protein [Hyalangium sp.]